MTEKILVIDDSITIQKVVKIACEPYDIEVATANSYLEAISETNRAQPDLVIADASLPGIKGAEDYAQLQKRLQGVPFIILQGSYEEVDVAAFQSSGFDLFLRKPFEAQVLIQNLEQALGRSVQGQQELKQVSNGSPSASVSHALSLIPPPPSVWSDPSPVDFAASESSHSKTTPPGKSPLPATFSLSLGDFDQSEEDQEEFQRVVPAKTVKKQAADFATDVATEDYDIGFGDDHFSGEDDDLDDEDDERLASDFTNLNEMPKDEDHKTDHRQRFAPPPPPPVELVNDDSLSDLDKFEPRSEVLHFTPEIPHKKSSTQNKREFAGHERTSTQASNQPPPRSDWNMMPGTDAQGLVEPFLREELAALVRQTVLEYCDRHFSRVAREIISEEMKKLTDEKARILIDK